MRGNWWLIFGNILFFSISYIHIKRVVLYILLNFSDEYIKYGFKFLTLVNCKYAKSDKSMELSFISWHKILKTSWTAWRCPWKKKLEKKCLAGCTTEGVQRRHDPRKNDIRASGFAELPPGPAKLVSQPPWRPQASRSLKRFPQIHGYLFIFANTEIYKI